MSQIPRQHFDAPRQLPAAANGGGTGEYDLSTALSPYTSDQYSPPSPHRQYVGGYRDETALYHDLRPSNYPVILVRDARALTDPSHPPPPPDRQSAAPESPWVAVMTEMAKGVASIIPSLVQIGIAKGEVIFFFRASAI
ncbi:hypothetical protein C2S52_014519 [Perilla frutescens var. hirtella]|nr:hypothetical protein C2S52_014519 [Perilla frutescens var. hirtella]